MFKNFLLIAFRNFIQNKIHTTVNIIGLTLGIASCIIMVAYVHEELSYDTFHENYKNIYRIGMDAKLGEQVIRGPVSDGPFARTLLADYPEVQSATHFKGYGPWVIKHAGSKFNEKNILYTDSNFLKVFTFPLIQGDKITALTAPYSIILTRKIALKYFGNINIIGKSLDKENNEGELVPYKITGIMEDVPSNSHFDFDMLVSLNSLPSSQKDSWATSQNYYTYFILRADADPQNFESKLEDIVQKYIVPVFITAGINLEKFRKTGGRFGYYMEPLSNIHLHAHAKFELKPNGNYQYVMILLSLAILILVIACINFMNLTTARSANRAKEVGISKVLGLKRKHLICKFLLESIFLSSIAVLLAVSITELLLPLFNNLFNANIHIDYFHNFIVIPSLIFLALTTGIMAGAYPAFFMSSFEAGKVLKGELRQGMKGAWLRKILLSFQFVVSIIIIIITLAVFKQLNYMENKELGFDDQQVLIIQRPDALKAKLQIFKDELLSNNNILHIATGNAVPGTKTYAGSTFGLEGRNDPNTFIHCFINNVSPEYFETFDLKISEGRFFLKELASDSGAIVVNQALVDAMHITNPVGKRLSVNRNEFHEIIGVVKDFHIESLQKKVYPLVMALGRQGNSELMLAIKISNQEVNKTIQQINNSWDKHTQKFPFEYYFIDKEFEKLYQDEQKMSRLFSLFAFLAISIAFMGLLGLITLTTALKTKEIAIRKILGSSISNIVYLLSKETLILLFICNIIAWPIAYIFINKWLQNFPYRMTLSLDIFFIASICIFIVAMATLGIKIISAAKNNPSVALRKE